MSSELNLLPPERRKFLIQREIIMNANHFIVTIIMGLVLMLFAGGASVIVLRGISSIASDSAEEDLARASGEYAKLQESIERQNVMLSTMNGLLEKRVVWSMNIAELVSKIPSGIDIAMMQGQQDTTQTISFSGTAAARNALIIVSQRIEAMSWVASLESPNSNLIDRVNAPYEFRITMK